MLVLTLRYKQSLVSCLNNLYSFESGTKPTFGFLYSLTVAMKVEATTAVIIIFRDLKRSMQSSTSSYEIQQD